MLGVERVIRAIEALNTAVGRVVAWLALGTVLACFATVYTRYALGVNFTWLQEIYVWQHAIVIVLGAAYTMLVGGFVRVDILYGKMAPRKRALVDLLGTLLLLYPFLFVLWRACWTLFMNSWTVDEGSPNPGGLSNLWILKGTLLVFIVLVALQGLAWVLRSWMVLRGREDLLIKNAGH